MSALQETWQRVGFDEPAVVERMLVRGALAGALAGALGALAGAALRPHSAGPLSVTFAAALLLLVLPAQTLGLRLGLAAAAALLPVILPWTPATLPYFFTVALGLALAFEQSTGWRRAAALIGPSLGGAWCLLLERWLSARHLGSAAALSWVALIGVGLFVSIGAVLARVTFSADAVEPTLSELPRVRLTWLRLRAALERLPQGQPRTELAALVREGAARCVRARASRDELASALDESVEEEAREAVIALKARLLTTTDPELNAHLSQLLRVHSDTLEQVDGLRRRVERLEARAAAEAGWLETAAFSVELAPRNDQGVRDLASRLRALQSPPLPAGERASSLRA